MSNSAIVDALEVSENSADFLADLRRLNSHAKHAHPKHAKSQLNVGSEVFAIVLLNIQICNCIPSSLGQSFLFEHEKNKITGEFFHYFTIFPLLYYAEASLYIVVLHPLVGYSASTRATCNRSW